MTATPAIESLVRIASPDFEYDFLLTGSSEPDVAVRIDQVGGGRVSGAMADTEGKWSINVLQSQVAGGKFQFVATAIDSQGTESGQSPAALFQPNIVMINTDDMRYDQVQYMPFVTSLADTATVFRNAFTPTSVAGPSRASLMT